MKHVVRTLAAGSLAALLVLAAGACSAPDPVPAVPGATSSATPSQPADGR